MVQPGVHLHDKAAASSSPPERRSQRRIPIPRVLCWSPTEGMIVNASRTGLCIVTSQPFQQGENVFLTIKLTGRTGRILGHARWCHPATGDESKPPIFHIGVKLTSPIEESWLTALLRPSRVDQSCPL